MACHHITCTAASGGTLAVEQRVTVPVDISIVLRTQFLFVYHGNEGNAPADAEAWT